MLELGFFEAQPCPLPTDILSPQDACKREIPAQGRATGDVQPSPRAEVGLMYLTHLRQTFTHCV